MDNDKNVLAGTSETEETQFIPLVRLCWAQFCTYWYWFVISVVVCLIIAFIYQQRKPRVYERQAVMLIEDAETMTTGTHSAVRSARGSGVSALMELNGISVGDNLINEMFILSSQRLMARVVDSLQLDVDYSTTAALHKVALYRERPFEVSFSNSAEVPETFKVRIGDNKTFVLFDFLTYDEKTGDELKYKEEITAHAGQKIKTPIGVLVITPNAAIKDFPEDKEITISHWPKDVATAIYAGQVEATEYDKESSLIVISCKDINGGRAEDIIRTLFSAYKQDVVDNKNRVAFNTARFIDERIQLIGEDLSGVESRMAEFKRSSQLIDFQTNAQAYITESTTARQTALRLETQLAVARYLTEFLQNNSNTYETVPLVAVEEASFTPLINDYNKVMIERNRMVNNASENSPAVRDVDRQLASLRSALLSSIRNYENTVELQLKKAQSNEAALSGKMNAVPDKEKQGLDIQRQQELKSALYVYLLNKREEVALQMAINEANVRLVEEPLGSPQPISPRRNVILLIGLILGIAIPACLLWLRRVLDVTISGRKDVEDATTIPIIGEIPHWEEVGNGSGIISQTDPDAPIVEAFRVVRYGLNFMRHSAKVFVVTSSTPAQGKSFVSSNLAYILGSTGKRVLLIDADIRKRSLTKRFGNGHGLTGLLVDEDKNIDLESNVLRGIISGSVDFLPAGKMPPNPSELLMSDRLDEIIDAARSVYNYVIIDTTPTLAVADADIVNHVADITIFSMRVGEQQRDFLPELETMYRAKKFRNLCIVINDADAKKKYGYSYGYGYGYGYGEKKETKKRLFGIFPIKSKK